MVNVSINKSEDREIIIVKGHAQFDINGRDIVCAAVSTLVHTLIAVLSKIDNFNLKFSIETGNVHIDIKKTKLTKYSCDGAIEFFIVGIELLEKNFSSYVKMDYVGEK